MIHNRLIASGTLVSENMPSLQVGLNPPPQIEFSPPEGVCINPSLTVPGTSVSSVGRSYPYPGTSVCSIRPCHNSQKFWKFCMTFKLVPELLLVLYILCHDTRRAGYCIQHLSYPPGAFVSYVRPRDNTQNIGEFCNTFIPVPQTSGSSKRLPNPYPESTNPTGYHLGDLQREGFSRRDGAVKINGAYSANGAGR